MGKRKVAEQKPLDPMEAAFEDPEPPDEDDPEFKEEMFDLMKSTGTKPEDLVDPVEAEEYRAWLVKNP
jgi:hypothetical protein